MDTFLENARRIFEVAKGDASGANEEFALLIRPDGGLHFIMESPFSIDAASAYAGAQSAYRVTRSRDGVRVEGHGFEGDCVLQERNRRAALLCDQPLYLMASPV